MTSTAVPATPCVLYVNHTGHFGGGEHSLVTLIEAMGDRVRSFVCCPRGELEKTLGALQIPVLPITPTDGSLALHPVRTPAALIAHGVAARQIAGWARALDADLIHANSIRAGLSAGLASRLGGPRVVAHIRDRLPDGTPSRTAFILLGRSCDWTIANSAFTAEGARDPRLRSRLSVIHNAVDTDRFDPTRVEPAGVRQELDGGGAGPVLGVLAQITPWKAQDDAIAITSLLRERYPQVRLVLAGSPKFVSRSTRFDNTRFMHQLRRSVSTLGLDENVLFLGERADIPQILGAIDFLLVPSTEEPFGRAMIEGMAMQVPVLATAVGGPAEVITYGDDGMLLPPRSPERWANEIATLFEAPDLARRMGERARQTVLERFTAARHSEQVLDVYRRVLTTQSSFRREQQMAGASGL